MIKLSKEHSDLLKIKGLMCPKHDEMYYNTFCGQCLSKVEMLGCCYHCSLSTENIARDRGMTIEEVQKERDNCNKCCSMVRRITASLKETIYDKNN